MYTSPDLSVSRTCPLQQSKESKGRAAQSRSSRDHSTSSTGCRRSATGRRCLSLRSATAHARGHPTACCRRHTCHSLAVRHTCHASGCRLDRSRFTARSSCLARHGRSRSRCCSTSSSPRNSRQRRRRACSTRCIPAADVGKAMLRIANAAGQPGDVEVVVVAVVAAGENGAGAAVAL